MSLFDELFADADVIYAYGNEQAVEDGAKAYIFQNRWDQLSGGKPITATAGVREAYSDAALIEMWNAYVDWKRNVMPTLPAEQQMFVASMNSREVWVLEDGECFTILHPEDY